MDDESFGSLQFKISYLGYSFGHVKFPISLQNTVFEIKEIQMSWMIFKDHLLQDQLNREFLIKHQHEKEARTNNTEKNPGTAKTWRGGMKKIKAHLELMLR